MRQPSRMAWSGRFVGPVFGVCRSVGDSPFRRGPCRGRWSSGSAAGLQVEQILTLWFRPAQFFEGLAQIPFGKSPQVEGLDAIFYLSALVHRVLLASVWASTISTAVLPSIYPRKLKNWFGPPSACRALGFHCGKSLSWPVRATPPTHRKISS